MALRSLLFLFVVIFSSAIALQIMPEALVPALSPLQYITPDILVMYTTESVRRVVLSTILPVDQTDALAIFLSESISGFLGGLALKGVSVVDGNKNNKNSILNSAEVSGAYFGVAGALRSLALALGLSNLFVNAIALVFAGVASEVLKSRSKSIEPMKKKVGDGPAMYDLMKVITNC